MFNVVSRDHLLKISDVSRGAAGGCEIPLNGGFQVGFTHPYLSVCAAEAPVLYEVCTGDLHLLVLVSQEIYSHPHCRRCALPPVSVRRKHKLHLYSSNGNVFTG